jgi:glyoxylase-like metal-dependent hydrolase (beta-lactamase superfamily II)
MRVHHLNCGTMRPPGAPPIVTHVLLVEADNGLVLVDTGYGQADVSDPRRLGPVRHLLRPAYDPEETAVRQVERLGFRPADVRDIVITHFDFDHIGGLADFPDARVHVSSAEVRGAMVSPSWRERLRYRAIQWAHHPRIVEHDARGETWHGFAATKQLEPGIVLIPLPGHTRGHAGVAVDAGDRWIVHCGDAFYHRGSIDGTRVPASVRLHEVLSTYNWAQLRDNRARLAELYRRGDPNLVLVCSHDAGLYERVQNSQT